MIKPDNIFNTIGLIAILIIIFAIVGTTMYNYYDAYKYQRMWDNNPDKVNCKIITGNGCATVWIDVWNETECRKQRIRMLTINPNSSPCALDIPIEEAYYKYYINETLSDDYISFKENFKSYI